MAVIYDAQLRPSKIELLRDWVSAQPWLGDTDASTFEPVGAYRFDDPEGEVGLETHLLRAGDGKLFQVPVTYRGAALIGADTSLITTAQHSVLGKRWVYDACGDPVYARTLAATILTGGAQADLEVATETGTERHVSTTQVWGSGVSDATVQTVQTVQTVTSATYVNEVSRTLIVAGDLQLVVLRTIGNENENGDGNENGIGNGNGNGNENGDDSLEADTPTLLGTWPGHAAPSLLAFVLSHGSA
jgi:hypothetical protein